MSSKKSFKVCRNPSNGIILRIHHTIRETPEQERRLRLISASFDSCGETLACSDHRGNIFVFDLLNHYYWKLRRIEPSHVLCFSSTKPNLILTTKINNYHVQLFDGTREKVLFELSGHTSQPKSASFSTNSSLLLTHGHEEAIVWETKTCTKYYVLNINNGPKIKDILFAPVSNNIIACFKNHTIYMWNQTSLEPLKEFPTKLFSKVTCFTFTVNGRILAIGGLTSELSIVNVETWKNQQINLIKENIKSVKQMNFLPYGCDGGSNKILIIVSEDCVVYFYNIYEKRVICSIQSTSSNFKNIICSSNGKYFACVLRLGEIDVYKSSLILRDKDIDEFYSLPSKTCSLNQENNKNVREDASTLHYDFISDRIKTCLAKSRLMKILQHFNEYPAKHRLTIWGALLSIPFNNEAYGDLINKEVHSSFNRIETEYKLQDNFYLKHVKRLMSCLFHWCPKLTNCDFLIELIFPFIKVFHADPLSLFEIIITILMNHCQGWFEFSPLIPVGTLALIENLLGEYDKTLLCHFFKFNVTSEIYAWQILKTGFSEVLCTSEWLILWDHIISNEPAFLLILVVSYNIVNRNALLNMDNVNQFCTFFIKQNPINITNLLKKSYSIYNSSKKTHPQNYLRKFSSLSRGQCYPQYLINSSSLNFILK